MNIVVEIEDEIKKLFVNNTVLNKTVLDVQTQCSKLKIKIDKTHSKSNKTNIILDYINRELSLLETIPSIICDTEYTRKNNITTACCYGLTLLAQVKTTSLTIYKLDEILCKLYKNKIHDNSTIIINIKKIFLYYQQIYAKLVDLQKTIIKMQCRINNLKQRKIHKLGLKIKKMESEPENININNNNNNNKFNNDDNTHSNNNGDIVVKFANLSYYKLKYFDFLNNLNIAQIFLNTISLDIVELKVKMLYQENRIKKINNVYDTFKSQVNDLYSKIKTLLSKLSDIKDSVIIDIK